MEVSRLLDSSHGDHLKEVSRLLGSSHGDHPSEVYRSLGSSHGDHLREVSRLISKYFKETVVPLYPTRLSWTNFTIYTFSNTVEINVA